MKKSKSMVTYMHKSMEKAKQGILAKGNEWSAEKAFAIAFRSGIEYAEEKRRKDGYSLFTDKTLQAATNRVQSIVKPILEKQKLMKDERRHVSQWVEKLLERGVVSLDEVKEIFPPKYKDWLNEKGGGR